MRSINEITERILGCSFTVSNGLGAGFLEKVYENALTHELRKIGLAVEQQYKIEVWYDDIIVGNYTADLLVEKLVLVELKAINNLESHNIAQCLNYLKATKLTICLLINFGKPRIQYKRIVNQL